MSYAKIRPRRGTHYEWSTENPVLYEGELVIEYPETGVGTGLCKFKIGDGITPYRELPYAFDGAAANSIMGGSIESFHLIQLRAGTAELWEIINPILAANEIAYDSTNHSLKVGDGVTAWNDLKFINSGDGLSNVSDYGDEDTIAETEETPSVMSLRQAPVEEVEVSDGTATISDLLSSDSEESTEEEVVVEESIEDEENVIEETATKEEIVDENEDDPLGEDYSLNEEDMGSEE